MDRVFVTGGSGSFGRVLLSRAEREEWDSTLIIYGNDEAAHNELAKLYPRHEFVLGDIRDRDWMACKMRGCDLVIHAAGFKGVPDVEQNPIEAIKTNVIGSINVAMAADWADVPELVALSTDKACQPANVYGCTKALMEAVMVNASTWAQCTDFWVVRLGNFVGSRGSVIPLFMGQEELTITDRRCTRFWMGMREAIGWVLFAPTMRAGVIIAPALRSMNIADVARVVAPGVTAREVGLRPGERLHELMVSESEAERTIKEIGYFVILPQGHRGEDGHEYSSAKAPRLTDVEMLALVEEWKRG